ncbi:MAG: DUF922 domain-containing protein [Gemmatimonadetes bacterium]|nr:DUF922 domain-containing protein [Gemmatimonadota bacterium]
MTVQVSDSHYEIRGATATELRAAMLAEGPKLHGWPLFASTEWEIRWRVRPAPALPRVACRLQQAEVDLTTRTVLPQWTPPLGVPGTLVTEWNEFLAALRAHERGHRDLGVKAAREVLHTLRTLRTFQCASVVPEADAAARRTIARYNDQNVEYDRKTEYGGTQGVVWPRGGNPTSTGRERREEE